MTLLKSLEKKAVNMEQPLEDLVERLAEYGRDPERSLQRGRIFARLDRGDRLAGDADRLAKFSLRHFAREEAQGPDIIGEGQSHHSIAAPVVIKLGTDADKLCNYNSGYKHIELPC